MSKQYTFEIYDADDNIINHETIAADTIEEAEYELENAPRPREHVRYECEGVEDTEQFCNIEIVREYCTAARTLRQC